MAERGQDRRLAAPGRHYKWIALYQLGFVVFAAASIALSLTGGSGPAAAVQLIGFRLVQGVGGALLTANSRAILTDAFPVHQRGMALGINQVATLAGSFVGLVAGGRRRPRSVPGRRATGGPAHAQPTPVRDPPVHRGQLAALLSSVGRGGLQFMLIIWLQGIWLPLHGYSFERTRVAGICLLPLTVGFLVAGLQASALTSHTFFPRLIAGPFHQGLVLVLALAAVMCAIAALASWLRGGRFVPQEQVYDARSRLEA